MAKENPINKANFLSRLSFWWLFPFLKIGKSRPLATEDLYHVLQEDESKLLGNQMQTLWDEEQILAKEKGRKVSYARAILRGHGWSYLKIGFIAAFEQCVLRVLQPLFLGALILSLNYGPEYSYWKWIFGFFVFLCGFLYCFTHQQYQQEVYHLGMKIRVASCSIIYRKALRLSQSSLGQTTVGQMVNLLSNDVSRFDTSVRFLHYLWIGPLQAILALIIMWLQFGAVSLSGFAVLILYIPLQSWMGGIFSRIRSSMAKKTDERVRLMNEIISAMRVIKMYTWEKPFSRLVENARGYSHGELKVMRRTGFLHSINLSLFSTSSKIITFLTFFTYTMTGDVLTTEKVFITSSLMNNIKLVMTLWFPHAIATGSETRISCQRLQNFLEMDEQAENILLEKVSNRPTLKDCEIKIENVTASWRKDVPSALANISAHVRAGQLLAVIGPVGSGKGSLLQAILGEIPITSGKVFVSGRVSYASQESWVFAGTIRENILFGQKYKKRRYEEVIRVCALERDLRLFPAGDQTMVGERGVSLSGGQKARVNLARAVYFDADIYLLDDPLSAVDTHVGRHLFDSCIMKFLKDKVRILVTHQLQYLKPANQILVLHEGRQQAVGNYDQLIASGLDFAALLSQGQEGTDDESPEMDISTNENTVSKSGRANSTNSYNTVSSNSFSTELKFETTASNDDKTNQEAASQDNVDGRVYLAYALAGGEWVGMFLFILISVLWQALNTGIDYWLSVVVRGNSTEEIFRWFSNLVNVTHVSDVVVAPMNCLNLQITNNSEKDDMQMYIYAGLTIGLIVMSMFRSFVFFSMAVNASKKLHQRMFEAIVRVPMKFFETFPIGQILNRFSKDLGQIDDRLPVTLYNTIVIMLSVAGVLAIVVVLNIWMIIPTVAVIFACSAIWNFYMRGGRSIKKLEGATRSPVFSHLSTSLLGLTTIRAFETQHSFADQFDRQQDTHTSSWFMFLSASRWLELYIDLLSALYLGIVTFSFLGMTSSLDGSVIALGISSAMMMSGMFQFGMFQLTETDDQMASVQRILQYSKLEPEASWEAEKGKAVRKTWPETGEIFFDGVSLQYDVQSPPVLKELRFTIREKEKIGIVGRTGAGKSSIITALFRLTEPSGNIKIDDVIINDLGLHDVRGKISIIPQDPMLFNNTMRKNLDPFEENEDETLWKALEEVHMKNEVTGSGGLEGQVSEGGGNLSVGQRQLVCLARALLKNNKVLVLDEATANVDPKTDGLIQETIRTKFRDCTVLTIAHRLQTIIDSDRVMVMEDGRLVEFDEPHILLQNSSSKFYSLVHETGETAAQQLHDIAEQTYNDNKMSSSM